MPEAVCLSKGITKINMFYKCCININEKMQINADNLVTYL